MKGNHQHPRRPTGSTRVLLFCVFAAGLAGAAACGGEAGTRAAKGLTKPDVVVIITDDQTLESLRVMPETQRRIGQAGVTFDQAIVSYPVCCPSRATFLTGQFSHNHGVRDNAPPLGGYAEFDDTDTLPVWLTQGGYHTAFTGKYLNGYDEQAPARVPPGWDDWRALLDPGTYQSYDYSVFDNGTRRHYGVEEDDYQTDVITDLAIDQIEAAPADQPLFINVNYRAPHSEGGDLNLPDANRLAYPTPAPRHLDAFSEQKELPSFGVHESPEQLANKPELVRRQARAAAVLDGIIVQPAQQYRRELASLLAVDEGVGKLLDAAARRRRLADTLVVFTSDNGLFHLEHGLTTKYVGYDPALRVPLLVAGPDMPAGQHYSATASNADLAPTVLAAAGIDAPHPLDGRALQDLVASPDVDRVIAIEGRPLSVTQAVQPGWIGARSPNWKYLRWADGFEEFYDLTADPEELDNLAPVLRDTQQFAAWRELANQLSTCVGVSCEAHEPALTP